MNRSIILVFLLFCFTSCSSTKHNNLEKRILQKEGLSARKYIVNKIILIEEKDLFLIGYNCRLKNGLVPNFIDGEKFKLVVKIGGDIYFLNDDEINNIKLLNQFKSALQSEKVKQNIAAFLENYKKGYIIVD